MPGRSLGVRLPLGSELGPRERGAESFLCYTDTADPALPKRVFPTGSWGSLDHWFTLCCSVGLGPCQVDLLTLRLWVSLVHPKLRRSNLWTSWPLSTVPHRVGLGFTFIFITAPSSMLSACPLLPLHAVNPCVPVWDPLCPPLSRLLLALAW